MRKLKFKIITYDPSYGFIKENYTYDEDIYNDDLTLADVINIFVKKNNYECTCVSIMNFYEITWNQFFHKTNLCDERLECEYYDYKIGDMCEQFNLENKIIELAINPPIGGAVGENRGIHYFFHTNEKDLHHVPHIHVKSGSVEFRVNLETLEIMDKKTFKNNKKNKLAVDMIRENQQGLINYWNKVVVKGESIKFRMFFPC